MIDLRRDAEIKTRKWRGYYVMCARCWKEYNRLSAWKLVARWKSNRRCANPTLNNTFHTTLLFYYLFMFFKYWMSFQWGCWCAWLPPTTILYPARIHNTCHITALKMALKKNQFFFWKKKTTNKFGNLWRADTCKYSNVWLINESGLFFWNFGYCWRYGRNIRWVKDKWGNRKKVFKDDLIILTINKQFKSWEEKVKFHLCFLLQ